MTTQMPPLATTLASPTSTPLIPAPSRVDWIAKLYELGPVFTARADGHDQTETFVADNYAELKAARRRLELQKLL